VSATSETAFHRTLGDERRGRIVAELQSAGAPLDASELARRVGLHPNTVRWHLGILADAGLVRSHAAPRPTPGRPRIVYQLQRPAAAAHRDEYRLLATVLAGMVSENDGGASASEDAGRAWGRELVRRPEPNGQVEEEAIARVVELLAEQGFDPSADGRRIEMRRCPFHDLAETTPEVVCAVHRGLISGSLAELGQNLAVRELEIFPRPDVCVAHLAPAALRLPRNEHRDAYGRGSGSGR